MNKAVPVLILDNTFTFGGAIRSVSNLLRSLDKQFSPVLVSGQPIGMMADNFTCTFYHYLPKLPWVDNHTYKKIVRLPLFRIRVLRKVLNLLRFAYWVLFVTLPEALGYYRLGRKHDVALVHLNNILSTQLAGILAAKFLGVPCVAHLRDFEVIHPITRLYARMIDHHVAVSRAVADNLRQLGVPDEKITVVHDAIDLSDYPAAESGDALATEFGLRPGQPRFGIFGRVVEWKGIREFILAAGEVLRQIPEATAFVVGDHSDGDQAFFHEMQRLSASLGLSNRIVFAGYRPDVAAMMGMMDVVVHASNRPEPFGMTIIEGMAMQKPVVATRGGGPLDIVVDGQTGLLVEMGDPAALADAILALLRQRELRSAMGMAARERVAQQFTSSRYAGQMAAIYSHLAVSP